MYLQIVKVCFNLCDVANVAFITTELGFVMFFIEFTIFKNLVTSLALILLSLVRLVISTI